MKSSGLTGLLFRHWVLVLACAATGAIAAICIAQFFVTPSYTATLKLYVSGTGATADDRLQNGEYARTHVASYADLVNSSDVLTAIRNKIGPSSNEDESDLADRISASNPLGTLIIDVTVRDSSPPRAQAVAAAVGEVYDAVVSRLESTGGGSPVRISVVSPPALPLAQDSPSRKLYGAVGLLAGLAVGTGVAWMLELRRAKRLHESGRSADLGELWSWWPETDTSQAGTQAPEPVEVSAGGPGESRVGVLRPAGAGESGPADS